VRRVVVEVWPVRRIAGMMRMGRDEKLVLREYQAAIQAFSLMKPRSGNSAGWVFGSRKAK
jgi:hypothetical protein